MDEAISFTRGLLWDLLPQSLSELNQDVIANYCA